jgi:hypothetical protein
VIVDRLTFVANWAAHRVKKTVDGEYEQLDIALAPLVDINRKGYAKWPYRYQFTTNDGLTIQTKDKNSDVQDLRFDFNPQTCDYKRVLKRFRNALIDLRVTRLDFAQDYDLNLSRCSFATMIPVKSCQFRARSGALETIYLGATDSLHRFRIYDKGAEMNLPITKWRIESQQRFAKNENWFDFKPFERLIIQIPQFATLKINERAMCEYLLSNPDGFKELNDRTRSKYKTLLSGNQSEIDYLHPHTFYMVEFENLKNEINYILSLTEYVTTLYKEF